MSQGHHFFRFTQKKRQIKIRFESSLLSLADTFNNLIIKTKSSLYVTRSACHKVIIFTDIVNKLAEIGVPVWN